MWKSVVWLLSIDLICLELRFDEENRDSGSNPVRRQADETQKFSDLDQAFFGGLENFQVFAQKTKENLSNYVARVVHSRSDSHPFICSCTCVEPRLFVTAARCIRSRKVKHTSVMYFEKILLPAQAFIIPSKPTKQFYDDIGVIVVADGHYDEKWDIKEMDSPINFTGSYDQWVQDIEAKLKTYGTPRFGVVGFATSKQDYRAKDRVIEYTRYHIQDLLLSTDFCYELLGKKQIQAYKVPCLLPCRLDKLRKANDSCKSYLAAEGGLIFGYVMEETWSYNIGVATWGVSSLEEYAMPVGFSLVNTKRFRTDYACAVQIRDDVDKNVAHGYYQSLCTKSKVYF